MGHKDTFFNLVMLTSHHLLTLFDPVHQYKDLCLNFMLMKETMFTSHRRETDLYSHTQFCFGREMG